MDKISITINNLFVGITENRYVVGIAKMLLAWGRSIAWRVLYSFPSPRGQVEGGKSESDCFKSVCLLAEKRVVHRGLPVTPDSEVHWKFLIERERKLPKCFVGMIENGRVFGKGTVIDGSNRVVSDVSVEFRGGPSYPLSQVSRLPKPEYRDGPIAILSSNGENGYFHWLFDVLPRVDLIDSCPSFSPDFYYVSSEKSFQKEYLKILGIDKKNQVQTSKKRHIKTNELVVPSLPSLPGNITTQSCRFLKGLSGRVEGESKFGKRIYVSRKESKRRNVINENELVGELEKFGFERVVLESLSVKDQIRLFRESEFIVAPHGAGLSNIVFSDPGTKVIEIFSPMYVNVCYWSLCEQIGIKYGYLATGVPHPPDGCDPHLVGANILVDTDIIAEMLEKFLK